MAQSVAHQQSRPVATLSKSARHSAKAPAIVRSVPFRRLGFGAPSQQGAGFLGLGLRNGPRQALGKKAQLSNLVLYISTFPPGASVVARSRSPGDLPDGKDFDAILSNVADKFEKSDNKPVIIGYSAAAIAAFFFSEWLISRPLLNILLGWPIQLLGLTLLPYFGVKYLVEGDSISDDASDAFHRVLKKLPGFENKV